MEEYLRPVITEDKFATEELIKSARNAVEKRRMLQAITDAERA